MSSRGEGSGEGGAGGGRMCLVAAEERLVCVLIRPPPLHEAHVLVLRARGGRVAWGARGGRVA
eukprot:5805895-Prymnesium_polylepis.1